MLVSAQFRHPASPSCSASQGPARPGSAPFGLVVAGVAWSGGVCVTASTLMRVVAKLARRAPIPVVQHGVSWAILCAADGDAPWGDGARTAAAWPLSG